MNIMCYLLILLLKYYYVKIDVDLIGNFYIFSNVIIV